MPQRLPAAHDAGDGIRTHAVRRAEAAARADEALLEADRCLECGGPYAPAPCVVACPADVDVPGFVARIARGDAEARRATIFAENLLGGSCARVCPAEVLCEGACVLVARGTPPVEIGRLQRFADGRGARAARPLRRAAPRRTAAASPSSAPGRRARLRRRARRARLTGHGLRRAHRARRARPLRDRALPDRAEPLPQEAALDRGLGVELRPRHARRRRALLRELERDCAAIFLARRARRGPDIAATRATSSPASGSRSPFVEALKTGHAAAGRRRGRRDRRRQHGDRRRARGAAARRARASTLVYRRTRGGHARLPARGRGGARGGRAASAGSAVPVRFVGERRGSKAVECRRDAARRARRERPARGPSRSPGSEFVLPADTAVRAIGQRAAQRVPRLRSTGSSSTAARLLVDPATGRTGNPQLLRRAATPTNGGATAVEAVARRQARRARDRRALRGAS